jgi:iron complex transport system substrate-binding protein
MRVVSLLPSATEIVCALGLEGSLVGRSHECDHPAGVEALPAVSLARIDSERLASAQIDRAVNDALARGEQLYAVDEAVLAELRPDLVITQTLCRVCAVEGDGVRAALRVRSLEADVVDLEAGTIDGVLDSVLEIGDRLGARARALEVVAELRARLDRVAAALDGVAERPAVFVAEWLDPPFAAGHWVPEMVALGGGREVLGRAGEPSYPIDWETVRAAAPEVCVLAPCGFDLERTLVETGREHVVEQLAGTPAGRDGAIVAVDATSYFSRPGPRVVDGVELCATLFHPERLPDPTPPGSWARVTPA